MTTTPVPLLDVQPGQRIRFQQRIMLEGTVVSIEPNDGSTELLGSHIITVTDVKGLIPTDLAFGQGSAHPLRVVGPPTEDAVG